MLQPGSQIGRYEIQRKLARGGMGMVYVAHDPVLGRMVAIKVFLGDLDLPDASERFAREARAAAALNHTNIVTIHDFGNYESQPYIVMEYVQGESLAEIIHRRMPVPLPEKLRWVEDLCAGVASAHRLDVVHRDLKPSNLMVDRSGRVKILDFGIAKMLGTLGAHATAVIGTPGYMAPEQLIGPKVDHRADLFSIGVVFFELLTYQEAFSGDSFTAITRSIINDDVPWLGDILDDAPDDLCDVVRKSLQKSADDRFQTAESLRMAINQVRRRLELLPEWDASSSPTIIGTLGRPTIKRGTGSRQQPGHAGVSGAALTPPPDPVQSDARHTHAARVASALDRATRLLAGGDIESAGDACLEALALDPTNMVALELSRSVDAALASRRVSVLLADARVELARGALTNCRSLLEQARAIDPAAPGASDVERELGAARVEQERLLQRSEAARRTTAAASSALSSGDIEAALALAREALQLDPSSADARAIEHTARTQLDDLMEATTVVSLQDVYAPASEPASPGTPPPPGASTGSAPRLHTQQPASEAAPSPALSPAVQEPTYEPESAPAPAPMDPDTTWADDTPIVVPPTPSPAGARPTPVIAPMTSDVVVPEVPAPTSPSTTSDDDTRIVVSPTPTPTGVRPTPVPPPTMSEQVVPEIPATTRPTPPPARPAPVPAQHTPPAPRPTRPDVTDTVRALLLTMQQRVAAGSSAAREWTTTIAAKGLERAQAVPRRHQLILLTGSVVLLVATFALLAWLARPTGPSPTGTVVIEAVPWGTVTAIRSEDGTNLLSAPADTPLTQQLPPGRYSVELSGPPPVQTVQSVVVHVDAGGLTVAPAPRFEVLTVEEYFERYGYSGASVPGGTSLESDNPEGARPLDSAEPAASAAAAPTSPVGEER